MCKQHGKTLVEHHDADRDSNQKDAENSKKDSEKCFTGMVPQTGGDIYVSVAVMDQVKFPHPFYLVLYPVDQPRAHEIEQHHAKDDLQPKRYFNDVEQTKLIGSHPGGRCIKNAGQPKSYDGCKSGKQQVDACMTVFVVPKLKEWDDTLHHPKDKDPADKHTGAEGGRNIFKKTDNRFKHKRRDSLLE